ncbi:hypothetical protein NCAS_0A09350 [Naumovozyma castellii]|uniref:SCP domain-containing protein n=1 Tax=Naumovozyma castellii TaxID=27288 RepID=G0V7P5_NAUCA|nr:hypothetical protein NCAS_0A09350 [Naumovozyma castellii CBS 4309]CCC67493.1 hypothetical protein NCAS_0A09350 [Naumovozyma castellii CBS 4309]
MKASLFLLISLAMLVDSAPIVTKHTVTQTINALVYVDGTKTITTFATASNVNATSTSKVPLLNATVSEAAFQALRSALQQQSEVATSTSDSTTATMPAEKSATSEVVTPATTTTAAVSDAQQTDLSDFQSSLLEEHNKKRALHENTGPLTWSEELAQYAQAYADNHYNCDGQLIHSGGPYGENLAAGYTLLGSVDAWYNEISEYDYSNPGFSESTGHFTQLVWKDTSQVGCAIKSCNNAWGTYLICSYNSAGNFDGEYEANVLPLIN